MHLGISNKDDNQTTKKKLEKSSEEYGNHTLILL